MLYNFSFSFSADFEDGLKRILLDISKQIEENSNFNDYTDLDIFLQENKVNDEETNFVIQEMEEFQADEITPIEDDRSRENVDSGIACAWVGRAGHCCKIVRIITAKISGKFQFFLLFTLIYKTSGQA